MSQVYNPKLHLPNRQSVDPQYDVMNFTTTPEEHDANVYLTISDDALSQRNENALALSDSATKRTAFADKLASMTDEDFRRQFKVSEVAIIVAIKVLGFLV